MVGFVGVPVVVADLAQLRRRVSVVVEIGDGVNEAVARRRRVTPDMLLDFAELEGEFELRLIAQILVAENQDVMIAEGGEDGVAEGRRQRPGQIGPGDRDAAGRRQSRVRSRGGGGGGIE